MGGVCEGGCENKDGVGELIIMNDVDIKLVYC